MNKVLIPGNENVLKMELKLKQDYPPEITQAVGRALEDLLPTLLNDALHEQFEGMAANIITQGEKTMGSIKEVEGKIIHVEKLVKSKHISPQDLAALESIVSEKAKVYVDKKGGVQTTIDTFLNKDAESLRDVQKLILKEHGRAKQRIWVELNKDCLERKGTAPKNRIKDTQVEQAFDFVRTWGGFTI